MDQFAAMNGFPARGPTRRATLAALPALAGLQALAGCSRNTADRLSFWGMGYEGDYAPLVLAPFTAASRMPVDTQSLPWTAAHEKLLTAHAGRALPDVFMLPNSWVGEFAMIGALAPLTDPALLADLVPGAARTLRPGATAYAVPWSLAPQAQFFRRDLLAQAGYAAPPTNWADWRTMGRAIKRQRPDSYAFLMLLNWWDTLFTFIGQTGTRPLRERDTRGNFRTPAVREALAFYVSLFEEALAPRVLSTEVEDPLASFAQGFFAVYPFGPTLLQDLHRRSAELPPALWGTERMPGPHGPAAVSSTSASLAISADSRHPRAAHALLAYMTSAASELRLQRLIGNLPASRSAWSDPALGVPVLAPFAAQIATPPDDPPIIEWERLRIEVQLIAERVVRGQLTVDQGLAEMDRRADRILAQRRALVQAGRIA